MACNPDVSEATGAALMAFLTDGSVPLCQRCTVQLMTNVLFSLLYQVLKEGIAGKPGRVELVREVIRRVSETLRALETEPDAQQMLLALEIRARSHAPEVRH